MQSVVRGTQTPRTAPRCIGTTLPGFTGILHTWGCQLPYHPHIHSSVPGGGLSDNRNAWLPSRAHCSVPVRALSPIYRAIFAEAMSQAGQRALLEPQVWDTPWNVPGQATPHGATSLTSLAPYVFTVAISNRRIVGLEERTVPCTYRQPGRARPRTTSLDVLAFIRRCLQHVLPVGFMQVRHCGFLHASWPIKTDTIRPMITQQTGTLLERPHPTATSSTALACPTCGAPLLVVTRVLSCQTACCDTGYEESSRQAGAFSTIVLQGKSTAPWRPEHGTKPFTEASGRHQTGANGVKTLASSPAKPPIERAQTRGLKRLVSLGTLPLEAIPYKTMQRVREASLNNGLK